ncbi:MAG TPA: hypothetical protein PLP29_05480 [Candidatus Ozemobacteraceae bacterium]|nr:hypothetical protein [Candidatus Ozemobacteraceae bacterium]
MPVSTAFLTHLSGAAAAVALLVLVAVSAFAAAARLLPGTTTACRLSGAVILAHALQILIFQVLAPFGLFRLPAVLACTALAAGAAALLWRGRPAGTPSLAEMAARDLEHLRSRVNQALATPARRLVLFLLGAVALGALRGIVNLAVTTDSLTYHLIYIGGFIRNGGWFELDAPGDWGVLCRFYADGGEILTAWWLLPFHGDLVAGLSGLPGWGLAMAAVYELARRLGLPARRAALPALIVGFMPAVFAFIASVYVDIHLLGNLLGGSLFFLAAWTSFEGADPQAATQGPSAPAFLLCGLAMGNALAIKILSLSGVGAAFLLLGLRALWSGGKGRNLVLWLLGIAALAAVGVRHYAVSFAAWGSPSWPFPLNLPGIPLFPGSPARAAYMQYLSGLTEILFAGSPPGFELGWMAKWLFGITPVSIGPVGLLAFALAPAGFRFAWGRSRGFAAFSLLVLAASAASLLGPDMWHFHLLFCRVNARLYTFPMALLILLAVLALERWPEAPRRLGLILMAGLAAIASGYSLFVTWTTGHPRLDLLLAAIPPIAALLPLRELPRFSCGRNRAILFGLLLVAALTALPVVKDRLREGQLLSAHEGHELDRSTSPAWVLCDDPGRPRRIAFSTGWDGVLGYAWYWGALLGRHLQNHVTYIPITKTGDIIEYRDPDQVARAADAEAWLRRLREERIDTVVLFPPQPPEHAWVTARPDLFRPEGTASPAMVFRHLAVAPER